MGQDSALSTETVEQVEPPDDDDGFHFAETDPSHRFGRFDAVLGRGAFKIVYKAFDTQEGTEVAWNQVRVSELMSVKDAENKEERDRLFAEIRVLKALKHKNIMSFYDSWYDPRTYTVSFITELFTSGTLRQYRKKHKHIDEEVVKRWAWQILCGLVYLHGHSPPIIHRDLKCDNIFINGSDGVVKIGDLGLATMLRSRTAPQSVLGTPEFMAPELYEEEYDDRVDVYSFGMCLLELSTMEYPYSECKNAAQIYRKVSLGVRPAGLQKVASPQLAEFINLCISARESRPRARQLLKHPYFDSIRKDKLLTSRSDAALAAHPCVGETASSEYGSLASGLTSGPVSRTASSLSELVHGVSSTAHSGLWGTALAQAGATAPPLQVVAAAGSAPVVAAQQLHPLSRTVSASGGDSHSDKAPSDAASVRSQRSNASELAAAVLENIAEAEENEVSDVEHTLGGSPTAGSRQGSPPGSPVRAGSPASPVKPGSPTLSDGCRCHSTERRFVVKGDLLDSTRVQLRLRICEPNGTSRTVEFEFDEAVETVAALAGEMVSDLELTPDDASVIATALEQELNRLSAEPQIDKQQSINLVHAALALPAELKSSALGQAHSAMGRELMLQGAGSLRQAGRFSEQTSAPLQLQLSSSPITQASAHPPADVQQPAGQQPPQQLPPQHPPGLPLPPPARLLRRSSSSSSSLVSASSVASLAHSVASAASQPSAAETWVQQQLGTVVSLPPNFSLARASPPPRAPSTQPGLTEPRSAPRPMSPLDLGGAGQADFPSPHQRVLRSHSIDATSMLSRSASLPPGREPVASPFNGSGALSPSSGILSPAAAVQEKRLTLMSLFENLADYQKQQQGEGRTDSPSPGLESAMAAAATASLPPLPHAAGGRPTQPSSSCSSSATLEAACGAAAAGQPAVGADVSSLLRPRSEACLSGFALQRLGRCSPGGLVGPGGAPGSAPTTGGSLAAAAAAAEAAAVAAAIASPTYASSNASPRSTGSQGAAAAVVDTIQRLDLQSTAPVPIVAALPLPLATARIGAYALSAPASKVPSRDASPSREREGSLSPTRIPCGDTGSSNLYGKRPPLKDKEALRRQAADAMKAVELRSLNLLEGGLGASKAGTLRGVPMAAARSMTALCNAVAPGLAPHSNGIAAMQHVPAGNGVMGGAAHPPPMAPPSAAASAALSASQMGSPSVSQLVLPHPVT